MIIMAKESFWIMKPFNEAVRDAFNHFKSNGYEEKLKAQITSAAVPPAHQNLLKYLYGWILKLYDGVPPTVCDLNRCLCTLLN